MLLNYISKCECGYKLDYVKTPFMMTEKRVCPACGKIHYVDECPTDWAKVFEEKENEVQD